MKRKCFSAVFALVLAFVFLLSGFPGHASQTASGRADVGQERKHGEISVDFRGVHIRSAVMKISELSGLSIVIDETVIPAREGEMLPGGISPRVTMRLEDVPAIDALDAILRMKNLAFQIVGNIVIITSGERLFSERLETRMYILGSPVRGTVEFKMPDLEREERQDERARLRIPD